MGSDRKRDPMSINHEWLELSDRHTDADGWAHHGVGVTENGYIVAFDATSDQVLILTAEGEPAGRWHSGLTEGHGITVVADADGESIWIADPGVKMMLTEKGIYEPITAGPHGRVMKFTLEGRRVRELPVPPLPVYGHYRYAPTAVAASHASTSGRVWVADGYGQSLVHVFSDSEYAGTLPGGFNCPHSLLLDRRRTQHELYVADRENGRVQVYGVDGEFRRTVGAGELRRPSALATSGDLLIVAELEARIAVFDATDTLVGYIGGDDEAPQRLGWPNTLTADGRTIRPSLQTGHFNSPHGLAVDAAGNPIVAEWLIGGRLIKLRWHSS